MKKWWSLFTVEKEKLPRKIQSRKKNTRKKFTNKEYLYCHQSYKIIKYYLTQNCDTERNKGVVRTVHLLNSYLP